MENLSIPSNEEILRIKKSSESPEKVIDEGDSLNLKGKIHSFYWSYDGHKIFSNDYEPIAVSKKDDCCLTRLHYNGIVVWQDFSIRNNMPMAYFLPLYHTPMICTTHNPYFKKPTDIIRKMVLQLYFLPAIERGIKHNITDYELQSYRTKLVEETVPDERKFTWNGINYVILVGPYSDIGSTSCSDNLKAKLHEIWKNDLP